MESFRIYLLEEPAALSSRPFPFRLKEARELSISTSAGDTTFQGPFQWRRTPRLAWGYCARPAASRVRLGAPPSAVVAVQTISISISAAVCGTTSTTAGAGDLR